jgi:hypothetical protein
VKRITIVRFDLPGAGEEGTVQVINLFEAGMSFAAAMAQVAVTPFHNLTQDINKDIRYLNVNGVPGGNIHEQLHATMEAGYSLSMDAKDDVILSQRTVFGSMVGLLMFISVAVFLPVICRIENAKDVIVIRLVELQPVVRKLLFSQSIKRYKALKRNCLTEDDPDDDDDDDDHLEELGLPPQTEDAEKTRDEEDVSEGQATDADMDVDWNQVMNTSANTAAKSKRGSSRRKNAPPYRKSLRSVLFLVLQFVGPLLAGMAFFTVIFATSSAYIDKALVLSSIAASATARASCSREVVMDVVRMMTVVADRRFMSIQKSLVLDTADCISYYLHLLAFGPDTGDYRAAFAENTPIVETGNSPYLTDETNAQVYSALFSDACPFLQSKAAPSSHFDIQRCRSFGGGVFAQGLQAGVTEYIRRTQLLADRRIRVRTFYGKTEVRGILLSKVGYDYTADGCAECGAGAEFGDDLSVTPLPPLVNISYDGDVSSLVLLNSSLMAVGSHEFHIGQDIQGADMQWIREADALYVTPGLFALADIYSDLTISVINDFCEFITVFVVVFLVLFVLFMLLGFLPQIRRTNIDIQSKRTMLLYLPPEIIQHNKAIKTLVHDILAAESDGVSRSMPRTNSFSSTSSR